MKASIFLLVALSGAVLSMTDRRVKKFKNQHIISSVPQGGCDDLIENRNIRDNNNRCKSKNTFIIGSFGRVRRICSQNNYVGHPNFYRSPKRVDILHCELSGGTNDNPCRYENKRMKRRITIACNKINNFLHWKQMYVCCFPESKRKC
uniref:Ribonuclease A-domain domain-containing protein n=1 Tax=Amphilophus citrinellus TaxID=61819 RepID=A0A3Q0R2E6_AMPCI